MAFTGYDQLMDDLDDLTISGVSKSTKFSPRLITEKQTPWKYSRIPIGSGELSTLGFGSGLKRATVELVVLVCPVMLSIHETNLQLAVTIMDSLASQLLDPTVMDTLGLDMFNITFEDITVGDSASYWSLVARIEVSG